MDHNELMQQAARYENRIAELEADVRRETDHRYLVESELAQAETRIAALIAAGNALRVAACRGAARFEVLDDWDTAVKAAKEASK